MLTVYHRERTLSSGGSTTGEGEKCKLGKRIIDSIERVKK